MADLRLIRFEQRLSGQSYPALPIDADLWKWHDDIAALRGASNHIRLTARRSLRRHAREGGIQVRCSVGRPFRQSLRDFRAGEDSAKSVKF